MDLTAGDAEYAEAMDDVDADAQPPAPLVNIAMTQDAFARRDD